MEKICCLLKNAKLLGQEVQIECFVCESLTYSNVNSLNKNYNFIGNFLRI